MGITIDVAEPSSASPSVIIIGAGISGQFQYNQHTISQLHTQLLIIFVFLYQESAQQRHYQMQA